MHRLIKTIIVVITIVIARAATVDATPQNDHEAPQRVVTLNALGDSVALRLQNGATIDVPAAVLVIRDLRRSTAGADAKNDPHTRVEELRRISSVVGGPVQAAVKIRYAHDGTIRRAKVTLFDSERAVQAFISKPAKTRRSEAAPKQ